MIVIRNKYIPFKGFSAINILGILFSAAGFIATIVVIIRKLLDPTIQTGWSSLMCLILITSGFLFLMLGIIGDYIGKIITTSMNKPLYVIREVDTADVEEPGEEEN